MLSPLRARAHRDGERGAVAILLILFLVTVAIPASALGLTTYVRSTARAELQQVADAAALAGASTIPLSDLDALSRLLQQVDGRVPGEELPDLDLAVDVDPLRNACLQANRSSRAHGVPVRGTGVPLGGGCQADSGASADSPAGVSGWARAQYFRDTSVIASAGSCLNATSGAVRALGEGLGVDPDDVLPLGTVSGLARGLAGLLPVLLRPGVVVQARQRVEGPLDAVLRPAPPAPSPGASPAPSSSAAPGGGGTEQVANARARRRFKNVVVLPVASVLGSRISVEEGVTSTTAEAKDALQDLADALREPAGTVNGALPSPVPVPTTGVGPVDEVLPPSVGLGPLPLPSAAPTVSVGPVEGDVDADLPLLDLEAELSTPALSVLVQDQQVRSACADVLDALVDDYDDALAPEDNPRTQDEIIEAALAGDEPLLVVLTGPGATLYDTLPVCFPPEPQRELTLDTGDTDGDGVPDSVDADLRLEVEVDSGRYLSAARCAPGAPGAFRATLVRS